MYMTETRTGDYIKLANAWIHTHERAHTHTCMYACMPTHTCYDVSTQVHGTLPRTLSLRSRTHTHARPHAHAYSTQTHMRARHTRTVVDIHVRLQPGCLCALREPVQHIPPCSLTRTHSTPRGRFCVGFWRQWSCRWRQYGRWWRQCESCFWAVDEVGGFWWLVCVCGWVVCCVCVVCVCGCGEGEALGLPPCEEPVHTRTHPHTLLLFVRS